MTIEEKDLLLKDLTARLRYRVCAKQYYSAFEDDFIIEGIIGEQIYAAYNSIFSMTYPVEKIKPYLRPLSSMTKKEKEEIAFIRDRDFQSVRKWVYDESIKETGNVCHVTCGEIDYCNKRHLDYRGLIEKGLALEAPEGMYRIE